MMSTICAFLLSVTALALPLPSAGQAERRSPGTPLAPGEIRLTFLGNAGWEITDGRSVILVDPYLTNSRGARTRAAADSMRRNPSDARPVFGPDDPRWPDTAAIDARIRRADYILITHGHADHSLDAPYIARKMGAVIIGHETAANIARAYNVADSSLITVRGGEDYEFGGFSLRIVPNIHSPLFGKRYYNEPLAGSAPRGLKGPLTQQQFVEGGNLAYLLRMTGHQVLIMGSMNYIEREMKELRPDIAIVGAARSRRENHDYAGRLMRALGYPAIVLPTHIAPENTEVREFVREVKAASPRTRVIIPGRFEPIVVPAIR